MKEFAPQSQPKIDNLKPTADKIEAPKDEKVEVAKAFEFSMKDPKKIELFPGIVENMPEAIKPAFLEYL